jgi:hypothetical protein
VKAPEEKNRELTTPLELTYGRALTFVNNMVLSLEAQGFPVSVQQGKHGTGVHIFGHRVPFAIVEKVREKSRRELKKYSWTNSELAITRIGRRSAAMARSID